MNINPAQMKALRSLLSKEDKQHLSTQTGKSVRLIEAVIGSERVNDQIVDQFSGLIIGMSTV